MDKFAFSDYLSPIKPLVMNNKIIAQDNALTSARYEMSSLEKNIVYMVMSQLRKDDTAETVYYISAKELMDKSATNNSYQDFKRATEQLLGRVLQINRPNGNLLQATMISSAEYHIGKGVIEIGLDPKIRPYFFDLKQNFTTFQLQMALSLNSKYSKRLYEMLSQYKNLEELRIDVVELKRRLFLFDSKTGVEQYKNWADFERRILSVAQKEICKKTDLQVKYETRKEGRRVNQLCFIIKSIDAKEIAEYDEETLRILQRLITNFNLRKDQAHTVIAQYSLKDIKQRLFDITILQSDGKIHNLGAYVAKIFEV